MGDLNVIWIHGAANCADSTDPLLQIHRFDADTCILRQGKCSDPRRSFEAPFLYLLIGRTRAMLLDAGATASAARLPLAAKVSALLAAHPTAAGGQSLPLVVAHSHSHGDHLAGNAQFDGRPDTVIVPDGLNGVKSFYGLPQWPQGTATLDLGERTLDVIPAPGHDPSHVVFYDRQTGLLLTGDTLYPGLLVVNEWDDYVTTAARLKAFAATHPVSHVLGAHIEMTAQPRRWFGLGTSFQPGEHALQLGPQHLVEWADAVARLSHNPRTDRHDDFIIYPANEPMPPLTG
jgi:hydroxyacylglutathione hydrolase